jgi:transcriptional regulator with XRE-family HTH domain
MARKFSELRAKMSPGAQRRAEEQTARMLRDMRLAELRRARELTQQQIAAELNVNQAWVSKLERQADMYLSTLRAYVEATGGKLEIIARYDDEAIRIGQLDDLNTSGGESGAAEPAGVAPAANAGALQDIRVDVFDQSQNAAPRGVNIWSGAGSNTGGSRTPGVNTTPPMKKAA